jgi:coenzyme Q-binding protein COQ10
VDGSGSLKAEARIRFKLVRERFATKVITDRESLTIDVDFLSGPFHDLANKWVFHPLEDGSTDVEFWIRYAFRNPMLQMLMNSHRERAILYLIGAFRDEAARRYTPVGEAG